MVTKIRLATAGMAMVDLGFPIQLGPGVSAAQERYRRLATEPRVCPARRPIA